MTAWAFQVGPIAYDHLPNADQPHLQHE
jgi:hypothetical protein